MKNYSIFLLLFISAINLHAQDYQISFTGTGASATVDSVKVENLTQGKSITIGGSEVLHLVKTITGINQVLDHGNTFRIYPNPMTDNSTIDFIATTQGTATIELFDVIGKRVGKIQSILTIGAHSFYVSGLCRGIYTVRISSNTYTYTGKLISNGEPGSAMKINYIGYSDIQVKSPKLKSANDEIELQYNIGDQFKFTGSSGKYSTICTDVSTQSKTITFTFVPCTDADGNNYPVVQIGTQLWMAENLKTTKYRNGDTIPYITDNYEWSKLRTSSFFTGACCDYDNMPVNGTIYGKLYNWCAVDDTRNIAPIGWHVPTDEEWYKLKEYVHANPGTSGSETKALSSTVSWSAATYRLDPGCDLEKNNSTGFTALPGGFRESFGEFTEIGAFGRWWSSTERMEDFAYQYNIGYDSWIIGSYGGEKNSGFSVRCLRNY
jgi:uncharacterized protein (TIGR02145 family)